MQPLKKNLQWAVFFSRARQKAVSAMWQTENDEPRSSKETDADVLQQIQVHYLMLPFRYD